MNTPNTNPDFFISVSTNPPKITGIGKTCGDSMEKLEIELGPTVNPREVSHLKGKIGRILGKPIIQESQMEDLDTQLHNLEIRQSRFEKKQEANKKPDEQNEELYGLAALPASPYVFNDNLDGALEAVKEDQATKSAALKKEQEEALAQKNADIEELVNKMKEHELARQQAVIDRAAITDESLIKPGTLAKAQSKLNRLQANNANNANEDEIKIVEDEIKELEDKVRAYDAQITDERNKWKETRANLNVVKGSGKKTKRRRNKRRKTKRRKTKRSKSNK
jgi:hypothetical protein